MQSSLLAKNLKVEGITMKTVRALATKGVIVLVFVITFVSDRP